MMGIDPNLYEAAQVDGANWWQTFTRITLPLSKPILATVALLVLCRPSERGFYLNKLNQYMP